MKKIILKKLIRENFKGKGRFEFEFNDDLTTIIGDNATGKTTTIDSWLWLFYGKDSQGKKDFEIKPLDKNNNVVHHLESSVEAVINVIKDDITITKSFKRIYKEKWTKRRGTNDTDLTGHETELFVNEVPMKVKEYADEIDALIDETTFKLITNVDYFHSLHWTVRRDMLIEWVGAIEDKSFIKDNKQFIELAKYLEENSLSLAKFKESLAFKRKNLKEKINEIPIRIDQNEKSKPELSNEVPDNINKVIEEIKVDIEKLTTQIENKNKLYEKGLEAKNNLSRKIFETKSEIELLQDKIRIDLSKSGQDIEYRIEEKQKQVKNAKGYIDELETDKKRIDLETNGYKNDIILLDTSIGKHEKLINDKMAEYRELDKKPVELSEDDLICPVCNQNIKADDIETKKKELQQHKVTLLGAIIQSGKSLRIEQDKIKSNKKGLEDKIEANKVRLTGIEKTSNEHIDNFLKLEKEIEALDKQKLESANTSDIEETIKSKLEIHPEFLKLTKEIKVLEIGKDKDVSTDDTSINKAKSDRTLLQEQLDALNSQVEIINHIKECDETKSLLENEMRELSQEKANIEQKEFNVENFERAKIEIVEDSVNGMFSVVKFKLFNILLNGGIELCCDTLINGVPYESLNTGSKLFASMDVIKFLNKKTGVYAPVLIDNKETVSVLMDMDCQLILLEKVTGVKKLQVK